MPQRAVELYEAWRRGELAEAFPNDPPLAYFSLASEPADERMQLAQLLATLKTAGWQTTQEKASELMQMDVVPVPAAPATAPDESAQPHAQPLVNRSSGLQPAEDTDTAESPLNEGELAALRLLGGGLNPGQVAADAEYTAAALREGMVVNSCNQYGHDADCDGADDAEAEEAAEEQERREAEEAERREREMDASSMESAGYTPEEIERVTGIKISDDEDVVTNAAARVFKRDNLGRFAVTGAVLKKNKGGRSSRGNPKNPTTKSNTPLKAARLAKPQAQVDAAEKAHKKTAEHGGSVLGAATIGKSKLNIRAGSPGVKSEEWKRGGGSRHQKAKHGSPPENTDDRDAAKAMVLGQAEKRSKGKALRLYKNIHAVTGKEKKLREMANITAYKKK